MTLWFAMALIDVGIVNVALPSMHEGLGCIMLLVAVSTWIGVLNRRVG